MRYTRALLLPVVVATLAVACGERPDPATTDPAVTTPSTPTGGSPSPTSPGPSSPTAGSTPPSPAATTAPTLVSLELWMTRNDELHLLHGSTAAEDEALDAALEALVLGPPRQPGPGVSSAIPPGTEILDVVQSDGLATVDLSSDFERVGGDRARILAFAQIVYTATQFESVERVTVTVDGAAVDAPDETGRSIDRALERDDYDELLPPIVVEEPVRGGAYESPISVAGTANVFEATVSIRILAEDGSVLAETFTTATCGTGCRGDFATEVKFRVEEAQSGVVEVFEDSPETGEPLNLVSIPVTLVP